MITANDETIFSMDLKVTNNKIFLKIYVCFENCIT